MGFVEKARQDVLRRLMNRRFGNVPEWAENRLKQAELKELEIWTDRILDAGRLEDVFEGQTLH